MVEERPKTRLLQGGVAIASLLVSHWPALSRLMQQMYEAPLDEMEIETNARLVVRMLEHLQCPLKVEYQDISEACSCEMVFLLAYLYNMLPQLVPRTTIEFVGRLQEVQVRAHQQCFLFQN